MKKWLSNSIAPLGIILLFLYIILYFSADYIAKQIIKIINILLLVIIVIYAALGLYAVILSGSTTLTDIQDSWDILSAQSKIYYYDNKIDTLLNSFHTKMLVTGSLYIGTAITGAIAIVFSIQYYYKLDSDWRPPLRSKISDERATRYINLYAQYNTEYKRLFEQKKIQKVPDNDQINKDKNIMNNPVENIIDKNIVMNQNNENKINNNRNAIINEEQFNVGENNENNENVLNYNENVLKEQPEKKKTIKRILRRKKKDEEESLKAE